VEKMSALPDVESRATKASSLPAELAWRGFSVGKSAESV